MIALVFTAFSSALAADTPAWTGEFADKKFLKGQAVFQLSLEQQGDTVKVWFSAVYNDGHGADPEAESIGRIAGKDAVEFTWRDQFRNSGSGRIVRSGTDVILSLQPTRLADPRCGAFYGQNMHLPRLAKK